MTPTNIDPELTELAELAKRAARAAAEVIMPHFRSSLAVEIKSGGSPVTVADKNAEQCIQDMLEKERPQDGWLGEEFGAKDGKSCYRWVIDPIDGTVPFIHGVGMFGTLLAVEKDSQPVIGLINMPALNEMVIGVRGAGAFYNGQPCRVSKTATLSEATVLTSSINNLIAHNRHDGFTRLVRQAKEARTWGDCYGYLLVATGRAEIMVDPVLAAWDIAPMTPIITEAGGCLTDLSGQADLPLSHAVASNGLLHEQALACFTQND